MTCKRESRTYSATILNGAALSNVISFKDMAYAIVHMPAAWTAASLGFQVASELGGTFQPLYDDSGTLVEVTVAVDQSFAVPAAVLAARYIKLWSETGGSGVNQGADRTIVIDMKA